MLSLAHYLIVSFCLLIISFIGVIINRSNILMMLMSIEIMILAINTNFIAYSYYLNNISGQIFVFFVIASSSAESAIGLSILIILFRKLKSINTKYLNKLNG